MTARVRGAVGKRRDKGLAVARYLTGETGIPLISWTTDGLDCPHPFKFKLLTEATNWKYWQAANALDPKDDMSVIIRYDGYMESIDDALVTMKIQTFTRLISEWADHHHLEIRSRHKED